MNIIIEIKKNIKLSDVIGKLCECGANENIALDCETKSCKYMGFYDN